MKRRSIVIIKPSSMGDVLHALPLLAVLRKNEPTSHIAWVVNRSFAELLEGHPYLDEVIVFEREAFDGRQRLLESSMDFVRFVRGMRDRRFDLALDLQGLFRSGLMTLGTGAGTRLGFAGARELAGLGYNDYVRVPNPEMHAVDRYLLFARQLGLSTRGRADFTLPPAPVDAAWAEGLVTGLRSERGPVVVMSPAARWTTKCWPAAHYAELSDTLVRRRRATVVFVGSAGDRATVRRIRHMTAERSMDLAGQTTLRRLAALLARADLMVSNDTGPMHLAAAVGCPVLAFFGPTSPVRTGPYAGATRSVVLSSRTPCAPCYRKECHRRQCLQDITPDRAQEEAGRLLEGAAV